MSSPAQILEQQSLSSVAMPFSTLYSLRLQQPLARMSPETIITTISFPA
jgi:hypothetical protein